MERGEVLGKEETREGRICDLMGRAQQRHQAGGGASERGRQRMVGTMERRTR